MISNVFLYGGFTGSESELAERDPESNPTILSGDLAGDDDFEDPDLPNQDENAPAVVRATSIDNARVSGFVVQSGCVFVEDAAPPSLSFRVARSARAGRAGSTRGTPRT